MPKKEMSPRFARKAARLNALAKRLGIGQLSDERIQAVYTAHVARREKARAACSIFAGCQSVTETARVLGMRRADLFAWLEREAWLCREEHRWHATQQALSDGLAVQRGRLGYSWPQLTPMGLQELARRLGTKPGAV